MQKPWIAMGVLALLPAVVVPVALLTSKPAKASGDAQGIDALCTGNARVVAGRAARPHQDAMRRKEVSKEQKPFAVIVGCADSRVPPELIFDRGLGDLFVVRVAGNVVDDAALGSIEYAVEHLGVPLIIVLGHERCGAVKAALEGGEAPGHIGALVSAIAPAIDDARQAEGDRLDAAVRAQIQSVTKQLATSEPILSHLVEAGKLTVLGARYDLDTGVVELLGKSAPAEHTAH